MRATFRSKWPLLLLAAFLVLGCDENPVTELEEIGEYPPEADIIIPDLKGDIVFGFGQTVYVESEDLLIEFTGVVGDSRCPMDAYCIWPGQAEILLTLTKRGGWEDEVILTLQPGRYPYVEPGMFECSCGYRVFFLALEPYPTAGNPIPEESYIAQIALEPDPDCCAEGEVCFTWVNPFLLQRDPFTLKGVSIDDDELTIDVSYGGGCRRHDFELYMKPVFYGAYPVRAKLYLSHDGNGDLCEALISDELTFDIERIAELCREQCGMCEEIVLEVFGYFTDQPGDGFEVVYRP